jgi:hypothetical protein
MRSVTRSGFYHYSTLTEPLVLVVAILEYSVFMIHSSSLAMAPHSSMPVPEIIRAQQPISSLAMSISAVLMPWLPMEEVEWLFIHLASLMGDQVSATLQRRVQ